MPRARGRGNKRIDRDTSRGEPGESDLFQIQSGRRAWPSPRFRRIYRDIAPDKHASSMILLRSHRFRPSELRRLQRDAGRQKQRRLLNIAQSPSGKAPDFDSGIRWFESNLGSHTTRLRIPGASIRLRRNIYDENRVL